MILYAVIFAIKHMMIANRLLMLMFDKITKLIKIIIYFFMLFATFTRTFHWIYYWKNNFIYSKR
jgi:hypothetical protein